MRLANNGSLQRHQLKKFKRKQSVRCTASWKNNTCASCTISDHTLGATMATIIVVIMANASRTSSATMAVTATTSTTTRRVPQAQGQGQGFQALLHTQQACQPLIQRVMCQPVQPSALQIVRKQQQQQQQVQA
jgi:hypothetical protein